MKETETKDKQTISAEEAKRIAEEEAKQIARENAKKRDIQNALDNYGYCIVDQGSAHIQGRAVNSGSKEDMKIYRDIGFHYTRFNNQGNVFALQWRPLPRAVQTSESGGDLPYAY